MGSSPTRIVIYASMAQRIAHRTSNPGVAGSNPAGGVLFLYFVSFSCHQRDTLAEWLRRRPAKPLGFARVGSNPTGVVIFFLLKKNIYKKKEWRTRVSIPVPRRC